MDIKPLLPGQPVTKTGLPASDELMQIIQRMAQKIRELEKRIEALEP